MNGSHDTPSFFEDLASIPSVVRRITLKDGWLSVDEYGYIHDASDTAWTTRSKKIVSMMLKDIMNSREEEGDIILSFTLTDLDAIVTVAETCGIDPTDRQHIEDAHGWDHVWRMKRVDDRYAWFSLGHIEGSLPNDDNWWETWLLNHHRCNMEERGFSKDLMQKLLHTKGLLICTINHVHVVTDCAHDVCYAVVDTRAKAEYYLGDTEDDTHHEIDEDTRRLIRHVLDRSISPF